MKNKRGWIRLKGFLSARHCTRFPAHISSVLPPLGVPLFLAYTVWTLHFPRETLLLCGEHHSHVAWAEVTPSTATAGPEISLPLVTVKRTRRECAPSQVPREHHELSLNFSIGKCCFFRLGYHVGKMNLGSPVASSPHIWGGSQVETVTGERERDSPPLALLELKSSGTRS